MDDLMPRILAELKADQDSQILRGTVTGFDGLSVIVKRFDAPAAEPTAWPKAAGLTLNVGDEVVLLRLGGGLFVLCGIEM